MGEKETFDKKLAEADKILQQSPDKIPEILEEEIYDEDGNFDELAAQLKNSVSFKFEQKYLNSTNLEGNAMF